MHHSTERALVKVTNGLLMVSDEGLIFILVQLKLSTAFYTIDSLIGMKETTLNWFKFYLSVILLNCLYMLIMNPPCTLKLVKVPQAPVLVSLLPIGNI